MTDTRPPDAVEAAWEALYNRFDFDAQYHGDMVARMIAESRPLIEAAIRASVYAEDVAEYERPLLRAMEDE